MEELKIKYPALYEICVNYWGGRMTMECAVTASSPSNAKDTVEAYYASQQAEVLTVEFDDGTKRLVPLNRALV